MPIDINNGALIPLAWPETPVRRVGVWYDKLMSLIGVCKNNYYKAGHAALVIADNTTQKFHYFDFGRYHTPHQYGRVRSAFTDPELEVPFDARFSDNGELENLQELLVWLSTYKACHGEGKLHSACYHHINIAPVTEAVIQLQRRELVPYGPFARGGSNCSRFVRDAICKASLPAHNKWLLRLPVMITPTTLWNIVCSPNNRITDPQQATLFTESQNNENIPLSFTVGTPGSAS